MAHTNNISKNHVETFLVVSTSGTSISHTYLGVGDITKDFSGEDIKLSFDKNIRVSWTDSHFSPTVSKYPCIKFSQTL